MRRAARRGMAVVLSLIVFAVALPLEKAVFAQEDPPSNEEAFPEPSPEDYNDPSRYPVAPDPDLPSPDPGQYPETAGGPSDESASGLVDLGRLWDTGMRAFSSPTSNSVHLVQLFPGPANYRDGNGSWHRIDPTLVRRDGGFETAANSHRVRFPDEVSEDQGFDLTFPEGSSCLSRSSEGCLHKRSQAVMPLRTADCVLTPTSSMPGRLTAIRSQSC